MFAQLLDFIDKDVFLRLAHCCPELLPDSNEKNQRIKFAQTYTEIYVV